MSVRAIHMAVSRRAMHCRVGSLRQPKTVLITTLVEEVGTRELVYTLILYYINLCYLIDIFIFNLVLASPESKLCTKCTSRQQQAAAGVHEQAKNELLLDNYLVY